MGIRNFFRLLARSASSRSGRRHGGHDIADTARDALGPSSGGGSGGRVTGNAVYKHLEKTLGPNHNPKKD